MNFNLLYFFPVFILGFITSAKSEGTEPIISRITVEGNQVTKEEVIRREIQHPVDSPFDSLLAVEDRNRIDNLGIFGEVTFFITTDNNGSHVLTYKVIESWRYMPFPIIFFDDKTGWSYGAGLTVKNFRGLNEMLQVLGAFGGTVFGGFSFQDPWIAGDHISLQGHFFITQYNHPFLEFEYREMDGEITIGRYFGYHWKIWVTGSVEKRWVTYVENVNRNFQHEYFQTKFQVIFDTRDVYLDPSEGVLIYNEIRPEFGLGKRIPYNNFWESQISGYKTVIPGGKKWVLGGSLFFHKYYGKKIPYRIEWVGGAESVRGWPIISPETIKQESYRIGYNSYYTSFELRQTVIPKYVTYANTEFGVIVVEFLDMGIADDNFFTMLKKEPIFGTGIGLRFFVPGAGLFRIDYGFGYYRGKWQMSSWHVYIGHKF